MTACQCMWDCKHEWCGCNEHTKQSSTDRDLIAEGISAMEILVRSAMAAGAVCLMERASAGELDPRASLGDALGDFPAEFIKIRPSLVADAVAEILENPNVC